MLILMLMGCYPSYVEDGVNGETKINSGGLIITVINADSCEYVCATLFQNGVSVIHKQNCKYCKARK